MSQPYLPPRAAGVIPAFTSLALASSSSAYDVGGALIPAFAKAALLYQMPIPAPMYGTPLLTPSKVMPWIAA